MNPYISPNTCLKSLDSYRGSVVPQSLPDLPKLSVSQLADKLEAGPLYLPLVTRVVAQVCRHWLLNLGRFLKFKITLKKHYR